MKWQYKGRPLANPLIILRRLVAFPFRIVLIVLLCVVTGVGWGSDKAQDCWEANQ